MSKIEIIYLKHKKTEKVYFENYQKQKDGYIQEKNKPENLTSQVKIHKKPETPKKQIKTETKSNYTYKKQNFNQKNYKRIFSIFTIICIMISSISFIAFDTGYLPVKAFLPVKEPVGTIGSIEIDNFIEEYKKITDIPDIEDLKYKIYISEATPDNIIQNYQYQLENEGYKLKYRGITTKKGIEFEYYGFAKGITAIGLLITDEIDQLVSQKTTILYTTGSVFDYKDIISWYKANN